MKKFFLSTIVIMNILTGCQKVIIYENEDAIISPDGCNPNIYIYKETPLPGDSDFARSQVNYYNVETVIENIQDKGDLEILSNDIVSSFINPYDRVYAIYYWIDENIDYDYVMLEQEYKCEWQNSDIVLQRKLGVCEGFSNLFCILCKHANINAVKIWGKVSYDATTSHAWNAVEIEGEWYVLDVTWDENKTKGINYFLINPEYFYQSHIPNEAFKKWKLF